VEDAVRGDRVQPQEFVGQFEVRDRVGERVGPRLQVAQHPVGLDRGQDFPLGRGVHAGDGPFARLRRQAEAQFKAFEEGAPVGLDGGGVLGPLLVE
jgi:hypothetical protein